MYMCTSMELTECTYTHTAEQVGGFGVRVEGSEPDYCKLALESSEVQLAHEASEDAVWARSGPKTGGEQPYDSGWLW